MPNSSLGGRLDVPGDRLGAWLERAVSKLLPVAFIAVVQGCGTTALEPWHTEKLTAEFTAGRADEIRSFEDYTQLEEELFLQLDEKVYANAHWHTQCSGLNRYGSLFRPRVDTRTSGGCGSRSSYPP